MTLNYFYYFEHSNYCLQLHYYNPNVSADTSFGLLRLFHVELGIQQNETPEGDRGTYRPEHCEYKNVDEDNSPNILSDKTY